jgi:hypothetical protein
MSRNGETRFTATADMADLRAELQRVRARYAVALEDVESACAQSIARSRARRAARARAEVRRRRAVAAAVVAAAAAVLTAALQRRRVASEI